MVSRWGAQPSDFAYCGVTSLAQGGGGGAAQALLSILDSPLNKAGKTKAIYVSTTKNVLIQINPQLRIPRTFRRFCGVMGACDGGSIPQLSYAST